MRMISSDSMQIALREKDLSRTKMIHCQEVRVLEWWNTLTSNLREVT